MYNIYLHPPPHKAHRPIFLFIHLISGSQIQHSHTATGIDTIVLYCCTGTVLIKHWEDNNYEISHTIFFFSFHKHICMQVKIYCMSCTKARPQKIQKEKLWKAVKYTCSGAKTLCLTGQLYMDWGQRKWSFVTGCSTREQRWLTEIWAW